MSVTGRPRERAREPQEAPSIDGKPPPHDLDAEAAVISAALVEASCLDEVLDFLEAPHFYSGAHQLIFGVLVELRREGSAVDLVTAAARLKLRGKLEQIGGAAYLARVIDAAPAISNVIPYARVVFDLYRVRQMIVLCQRTSAAGYGDYGSADAFLAEAERETIALASTADTRQIERVSVIARRVYEGIAKSQERNTFPGVSTGFHEIDDLTTGLHMGDLTVVGARPGMGKTAFALSLTHNVAGAPAPLLLERPEDERAINACGFFSLEMPRAQLAMRSMALESGVSSTSLRRMRLTPAEWSKLAAGCQRLVPMEVYVDDTPSLHIHRLRAKVRRIRGTTQRLGRDPQGRIIGTTAKLVLVVVDYLQLMTGRSDGSRMSRQEEVSYITKSLKDLAKEEDVHVLALCQLNREVEKRTGAAKRPGLADLRESGEIEQSADNIVLLYRPEYYGESVLAGEEGLTEIIYAKQRNGPTGTKALRYHPSTTRFTNM